MQIQVVGERTLYYIVGCCLPPDDLTALEYVKKAWEKCPGGCTPLLIGDLNIKLDNPQDEKDAIISEWQQEKKVDRFQDNWITFYSTRNTGRNSNKAKFDTRAITALTIKQWWCTSMQDEQGQQRHTINNVSASFLNHRDRSRSKKNCLKNWNHCVDQSLYGSVLFVHGSWENRGP